VAFKKNFFIKIIEKDDCQLVEVKVVFFATIQLDMQRKTLNLFDNELAKFQSKSSNVKFKSYQLGFNVFEERLTSYLNEFKLFASCYNAIPNFIDEIKIDCKKAIKWFSSFYKEEVTDCFFSKRSLDKTKVAELDDIFFFLFEDLVVYFDINQKVVRFLFRKTDYQKVELIIKQVRKFKTSSTRKKPAISLLVNTFRGIDTKSMEVNRPKLSIEDNYNEDFKEVHDTIIKRLSKKNDKGLVLLHGKPGTGKTSYIRYLISKLNKHVIFLPPNMASAITNPNLISLLIDNPNSVFVIEDAENIVVDREKDGYSPVSALLNISDGLLSDCLNIQVICSFNTDLSKIDNALLRKGRLIAKYEFAELNISQAQLLSDKLGFNAIIQKPMTLSEIYNQSEREFNNVKTYNKIGFGVNRMVV
jgi:hypothetical protein